MKERHTASKPFLWIIERAHRGLKYQEFRTLADNVRVINAVRNYVMFTETGIRDEIVCMIILKR